MNSIELWNTEMNFYHSDSFILLVIFALVSSFAVSQSNGILKTVAACHSAVAFALRPQHHPYSHSSVDFFQLWYVWSKGRWMEQGHEIVITKQQQIDFNTIDKQAHTHSLPLPHTLSLPLSLCQWIKNRCNQRKGHHELLDRQQQP